MKKYRITLEIISDFNAIRPYGTYPTHVFDWDDDRSFEQMKQELREFMAGTIGSVVVNWPADWENPTEAEIRDARQRLGRHATKEPTP